MIHSTQTDDKLGMFDNVCPLVSANVKCLKLAGQGEGILYAESNSHLRGKTLLTSPSFDNFHVRMDYVLNSL